MRPAGGGFSAHRTALRDSHRCQLGNGYSIPGLASAFGTPEPGATTFPERVLQDGGECSCGGCLSAMPRKMIFDPAIISTLLGKFLEVVSANAKCLKQPR